jgi:hypothetical protein
MAEQKKHDKHQQKGQKPANAPQQTHEKSKMPQQHNVGKKQGK